MKTLALGFTLSLLAMTGCKLFSGHSAAYRHLILADGPIAYYEMNDDAGPVIRDSSPTSAHPGNAKGGVTLGHASASPGLGKAARFDGSSGRIQIASHPDFRSIGKGPCTVEFWFHTSSSSRGDLINYKIEEGPRDFGIFSCENAEGEVSQYEAMASRAEICGIAINAWHHVALTRDAAGTITLFVDGAQRDTGTGEMSWDFGADLLIGSNHMQGSPDSITYPFAGWIDEVAIYNKALPTERIEARVRAGLPSTATPASSTKATPAAAKPAQPAQMGEKEPAFPQISLPVNREGFSVLFDGNDFSNFRFHIEGKDAEPAKTFSIDGDAIICKGQQDGYMLTRRSFRNFTLRLDWRYKRPPSLTDDAQFLGNSGYLIWITEPDVLGIWPRSVEVQGMNRDAGKILPIPRGIRCKFEDLPETRRRVARAVGEWNEMEIVAKDGTLKVLLNGEIVSRVSECELQEGPIGFQSEGAEIHWRNIRIREEE